jgi:hypothetical protein
MNPDEEGPTVEQLNERLLERWRKKASAYRKERNALREERDGLTEELFKMSGGFEARIAASRQLREQLEQAHQKVDELRFERNYWRDAVVDAQVAQRSMRIDGDLLADIIANQCPLWMTTEAARDLAEEVVSELTRYDDITVLRGTNSEPWTPDTETTNTCDAGPTCTVDVTYGDEWTEYGVFVTAYPDEGTTCLVDGCTSVDDALALAQRIRGAWVSQRRVVPEQWSITDLGPNPASA